MAAAGGAAAVSFLQPMFLTPTREELYLHFKTIAEAIPDTPVLEKIKAAMREAGLIQ